jgi:hypothetical protein
MCATGIGFAIVTTLLRKRSHSCRAQGRGGTGDGGGESRILLVFGLAVGEN